MCCWKSNVPKHTNIYFFNFLDWRADVVNQSLSYKIKLAVIHRSVFSGSDISTVFVSFVCFILLFLRCSVSFCIQPFQGHIWKDFFRLIVWKSILFYLFILICRFWGRGLLCSIYYIVLNLYIYISICFHYYILL